MPVFVAQSTGDDFVIVQGVDPMVDKWCSAGADVTYRRYDVGPVLTKTGTGHLIGMFPAVVEGLDWLDQRFSGRESQSGCTA
ncbi:lipase family protein [Rhodococcus sp. DMU2021]|uniref:lipase family protein n=1 Tax=Rhodococcus sp. DMU2021 TaxID=2866997 RepID=UPI002176CD54|nr:lipase family protein [Rhodococcus sp. DMU2021]